VKLRQEAEALDGPVLRRIGVGFVLVTLFGVLVAVLMLAGAHAPKHGAPAPFTRAATVPGADETEQYRKLARPTADPGARLRAYGWVDRDAGIVHVPVERAFELMATDGAASATSALPARSVR